MQAYQITDTSAPPRLVQTPKPDPAPGEVLLRIRACGLNFADLLMAKGTYQDTPTPPFTLGMEVCGDVVALGEGVGEPRVGTRVAVFGGQGGLAEFGTFPAALCRPVPEKMSDAEAAGFQVAYGTSHLALTRRARLQSGENLVVFGAAGGVGLTAVEIGHALGAHVIAVARGAEKCGVAKSAGADVVIDSTEVEDLKGTLRDLGGVDVLYDPVGGAAFDAALRASNREARLITIGFASGDVPRPPANHLLVKNIDVIGFYWGGYLKFDPAALTDSLAELMDWYDQGRLTPHISHTIPLDRAEEGLELMRSRASTGKVVICP